MTLDPENIAISNRRKNALFSLNLVDFGNCFWKEKDTHGANQRKQQTREDTQDALLQNKGRQDNQTRCARRVFAAPHGVLSVLI